MQNPNTSWSCPKFVEFMKYSPKMAYDYRAQCGMGEVPEEYRDKIVEEVIEEVITEEATEEVVETTEVIEVDEEVTEEEVVATIEPTIEQMKELLEASEVKYSHLAGEKRLRELCVENNLM